MTDPRPTPAPNGASKLQFWIMSMAVAVVLSLVGVLYVSLEREHDRMRDEIRDVVNQSALYATERQLIMNNVERNSIAIAGLQTTIAEIRDQLSAISLGLGALAEKLGVEIEKRKK